MSFATTGCRSTTNRSWLFREIRTTRYAASFSGTRHRSSRNRPIVDDIDHKDHSGPEGNVKRLQVVFRHAFLVAAAVGVAAVMASAQKRAGGAAERPTLEGGWVRVDVAGSGEFGGLTSKFTPAALTPQATEMLAAARQAQNQPRGRDFTDNRVHKEGEPYIVVDRPCGGGFAGGALGVNPDSGAIHIIVQRDEIIIAPERGGVRHIFMEGRAHADLYRWDPNAR